MEPLKVWFLSPEVAPFAKTGGLADVAGSLPGALKKIGVETSVGLPFYRVAKEGDFTVTQVLSGLEVPMGDDALSCRVWGAETEEGIPVYFFDREDLFDRPNLYGTSDGDYYDNLERFSFLCRAALCFAQKAGLRMDVIHCHDWQTGLVPLYLRTVYRDDPFFSGTASLFTIHNIGYQGLFPPGKLRISGIPSSEYQPEGVEYWGQISLLKAGIVYSDAVTTVSPRYSVEIQSREFGLGMEGILSKRAHVLHGILNGADYSLWDPSTDRHLVYAYSPGDMEGKARGKLDLLRETGLDQGLLTQPLFGVISRLSAQKGCDLILEVAPEAVKEGAGLLILGAGEEVYEKALGGLQEEYPGRIAVKLGFDEALAHRIMAGADMLLIPSLYEPCGLTQMYALRYGTVPLVRATGGLEDTVTPFDPATGQGNGFKFTSYDARDFLQAIRQAVRTFHDAPLWRRLVSNGMKADFSWNRSAQRYVEIYRSLLASP
ncbi:MAG: glycogen synthase GlgA [Deltaproteobacteria bacterium]|nr:glycogen synthase GlgA [Deltaproteobacteria bacterium]